MRFFFTLLFFSSFTILHAQPANDECAGAISLTLGNPPPCPANSPVTNTFNFSNNGATPTTPYPTFSNCATGGQTNAPADEVWFTFTPNSNQLQITVSGGLANPNIVIFTGNNCSFLTAIECARGNSSPLTLTLATVPNQQYYMLISGGFVGDQADFTLTMVSSRDCNPCLQSANFVAFPPPLNGTYNSGQTVNFCYTITQWNVTGTIEWLHAVELNFGPGWDVNSLIPTPPPSCGGDGAWGWYDSWVSCATGQTFGPGFAYDSSSGLGCGGTPGDGNPGNNWGDGLGSCANIGTSGPPSVSFCWSITVGDCPPNITGNSLSIIVNVLSDGDSGSWTQVGCNSGVEYNFLASAVCCDDGNPIAIPFPTRCPGVSDGSITFEGSAPGKPYNLFLFNDQGQLIFETTGAIGPVTADNLPPGQYSVLAVNVESGCQRSVTVVVEEGLPPQAMASNTGPYCPGDPIFLMGSYTFGSPASNVTYQWSGPSGFNSSQQNPANATQPGTYSLVVNVDGCLSAPATTTVTVNPGIVNASASPAIVCPGAASTLTATGSSSYVWSTGQSGNSIVVNPTQTTTYTVSATNSFGCTATNDVTVEVHPVPNLIISGPPSGCDGEAVVLFAVGGPFTQYVWNTGQTGSTVSVDLAAPQAEFAVTATTGQGCTVTASTNFVVYPNPDASVSAAPANICAGQTATLNAAGGSTYEWSNNASGASITVAPSATTTYQVTVTAVDGCSDTASVTVNVAQPLAAPVITCANATSNSVTFSWGDVAGATGYTVNVLSGQTGVQNGNTYTVSGLAPGTAVTIQVSALSGSICPNSTAAFSCSALACPSVSVDIVSPGDFCFGAGNMPVALSANVSGGSGGTGAWSGPGVTDSAAGVFHPDSAGVGSHTITYTYSEGPCDYTGTVLITIYQVPSADFSTDAGVVCTGGETSVTYTGTAASGADYTWNFDGGTADPGTGAGPHEVSWSAPGMKTITLTVAENGCVSEPFSQSVQVDAPLAMPVINCATSTSEITFSWADVPGATGYEVTVLSGPAGVQSGNTYTVSGLMPGDTASIRVTALNPGPCGPSSTEQTCTAQACPAVSIAIDTVAPICLSAATPAVTLNADVSGGAGGGASSWSGPGVSPGTAVFNPNAAGAGTHNIAFTYQEGSCSYNGSLTIVVHAVPTALFSASGPVCLSASSTVNYTGTASGAAGYDWDFGGGTANPGTGQGPHAVTWSTPGMKTIMLTVTENGCTSAPFTQSVQVDAPLAAPVITCGTPTTTSVTFTWPAVPGATGYQVNVLSGQSGALSGTTYTVAGLSPGETVEIEVTAEGPTVCGPSTASLSCSAASCPVFNITIAPVASICLPGITVPQQLQATVSGGSAGAGLWSGPGIIDAGNGIFDPQAAGTGQHTITYTYTEGPCIASATLTIDIFTTPAAAFAALPSALCTGQTATLTFTGTAGQGAAYNWNFGGGAANPGTGAGPHSVSWATPGTKTLSLTVTENGCVSPAASGTVTVEAPLAAPVINCTTSTSEIVFSWTEVPGASGYEVTVLSGATGVQSGNTYTVSGLMPGDAVSIRVTALNPGPCGPSSSEQTCVAQNCPAVSISFTGVEPVCLRPSTLPLALMATVSGGAGGGTGAWSGPGITNGAAGIFDPAVAGPGVHTILYNYQEGTCAYNNSMTITVIAQPVAAFTAPGAICISANADIVFTGTAPSGAVFNWNFDGGIAAPGTGAGPHSVSWSATGTKTITLAVNDNNCASEPFTQMVQVDAPLASPQITCSSTSTSITFSWAPVPGAGSYQVVSTSGPQGTLSGTTYTVSGLTPNQPVSIEVTAVGTSACGNSTATATCIAQNCPTLALNLTGTLIICAGEPAAVTFNFAGSSTGPFTVTYSIDGGAPQTGVFTNGQSLPIQATTTTTITAISITDNSLPDCTYTPGISWTIFVTQPVSAGVPAPPRRLCAGENTGVNLADLLSGASPGGNWSETSAQPSAGGAFNAAAGTFTAAGQAAGTYTFRYAVPGPNPCPSSEATVTLILEPSPVADAGPDQALTCNMGMVSLGGSGTSAGPGITYLWSSSTPGVVIANPEARIIEVAQAGTFLLTVTNDIGCSSSDEAVVSADFEAPVAQVELKPISCFQSGDGSIRVTAVSGGHPPYEFSLNGGAFSAQQLFAGLDAGQYMLVIRDQNGCFSELTFLLEEPQELRVQIRTNLPGNENLIESGDSVRLEAVFTPGANIDTISWMPDSVSQNSPFIWVRPTSATLYGVTVVDRNGCRAEDRITIFVERNRRVFIPNAFSPNDDGINDIFTVFADPRQVRQVKSFLVFNRWGETMFELYNFLPNNPSFGWNGRHREQLMNAGVYVYYAELEFNDGEILLYKGDVTLIR